jgi:hypothetical protein
MAAVTVTARIEDEQEIEACLWLGTLVRLGEMIARYNFLLDATAPRESGEIIMDFDERHELNNLKGKLIEIDAAMRC